MLQINSWRLQLLLCIAMQVNMRSPLNAKFFDPNRLIVCLEASKAATDTRIKSLVSMVAKSGEEGVQ